MAAFLLTRAWQSVILLIVMSLIVFIGVFAIGNPIDVLIDPAANQLERDAAIKSLGLDTADVAAVFHVPRQCCPR